MMIVNDNVVHYLSTDMMLSLSAFSTPVIPASVTGAAPLMAVAAQVSLRKVVVGVMNNAPHVLVTSVHQ